MTIEEAIKMIKAELECRNRQASGTDRDCIHNNCEECHLLYEQGAEGEQEEALDMAIKALEQQRWTPVSKGGLPIKEGSYMCTLIGEHDTGEPRECSFMPYGTKGMIGGWSTCEADGFVKLTDSEVIAWMPLPEPYKAESEDKE